MKNTLLFSRSIQMRLIFWLLLVGRAPSCRFRDMKLLMMGASEVEPAPTVGLQVPSALVVSAVLLLRPQLQLPGAVDR